MNTDYRETNTFEEATNNYKEDYKKFGSYRYLKYIPETKVLFRNFYHGEPSCGETVQAYKNQTLVADSMYPTTFRIIRLFSPLLLCVWQTRSRHRKYDYLQIQIGNLNTIDKTFLILHS